MTSMLRPLGWLYGRIINLRNSLYDRGILKSYSLGARTISIGNITTGGTGKTPLVAYVAEILADAGERVCVLTRGYARKSSGRVLVSDGERVLVDAREGGDEPVELAWKLIDKAIVIADADRVSAAAWAKEKFGVTAFVLDDAFQHRRARRDLDIVCIDATNPFGGDRLLPAGQLREPLENLERAGAIVITRTDIVNEANQLIPKVRQYNPASPVFLAKSIIQNPQPLKNAFAFCAIGNPDNFFESLRRNGYRLLGTKAFQDHHYYTQGEIVGLAITATESDADVLVTTAKDMAKLKGLESVMTLEVIEIRTEVDEPEKFRRLITSS